MNVAKISVHWSSVLLLLLSASCAHHTKVAEDAPQLDRRIVAAVVDEQVALGIVCQRTIYSYHFIPGTDELNELGQRDLIVLADYYRRHPGNLSLWRDQTAPSLTQAREAAVRSFLEHHDVQVSRMTFNECWPGGNGILAEAAAARWMASEAVDIMKGAGGGAALPQGPPTSASGNGNGGGAH